MQPIEAAAFSSLSSYALEVADECDNQRPLYRPAAHIGRSLFEIAAAEVKKGKASRDFGPELFVQSAYVGRFRGAKVGGKFTSLQTAEGEFVETNAPRKSHQDIVQQFRSARAVPADVPAGFLLGGFRARNYFHWMCEALPTIEYIKRTAHPECRVVIGRPDAWVLQSLELAGIAPERIDIIDDDVVRVYQTLYLPFSAIGHYHWLRPQLESFYHAMRPSDPHEGEMKCLYISRRKTPLRPMNNEEALEQELAARGFSIVQLETLSVGQQIDLFRRAKLVVAPHGAGLANLVFCKKGTPVYEILPANYIRSMFFRIAQYHGLQYHANCHKVVAGDPRGAWNVKFPRVLERVDRLLEKV